MTPTNQTPQPDQWFDLDINVLKESERGGSFYTKLALSLRNKTPHTAAQHLESMLSNLWDAEREQWKI